MPSKCVITTRSRSKPCLKLDYKSIAIEYLNKVINKVVISAPSIAIKNCKVTGVNKMRTLINNPILSGIF